MMVLFVLGSVNRFLVWWLCCLLASVVVWSWYVGCVCLLIDGVAGLVWLLLVLMWTMMYYSYLCVLRLFVCVCCG